MNMYNSFGHTMSCDGEKKCEKLIKYLQITGNIIQFLKPPKCPELNQTRNIQSIRYTHRTNEQWHLGH